MPKIYTATYEGDPMNGLQEITPEELAQDPKIIAAVMKSQSDLINLREAMHELAVEIIDTTVITDSPVPRYDGIHDKYRAAKTELIKRMSCQPCPMCHESKNVVTHNLTRPHRITFYCKNCGLDGNEFFNTVRDAARGWNRFVRRLKRKAGVK